MYSYTTICVKCIVVPRSPLHVAAPMIEVVAFLFVLWKETLLKSASDEDGRYSTPEFLSFLPSSSLSFPFCIGLYLTLLFNSSTLCFALLE